MRQPIQRQLLMPMLAVVVLGSAVTAMLAAWFGTQTARRAELERLQQLVSTLTDPGFPLTDAVLKRMSDLSGADFVTLNETGGVLHASRPFAEPDQTHFAELPIHPVDGPLRDDRRLTLSTGDARAVRMPIRTVTAAQPSSLVILTSQQRWNDLAWRAALPPLLAGLLAATSAAIVAAWLSRRFVRRIHALGDRAALLAEGHFEPRPLPAQDDELRDLEIALNAAAEKLVRYEDSVRKGERLQTLGRLGAGMAHQLRNAITGARMALDLHGAELPADSNRESLSVATVQLTLMEAYLRRFLTLGRGESPAWRTVDLVAVIHEILPLVEPICRHHAIRIAWTPPGSSPHLLGDVEALRQLLLNLVMNAIEAVQPLPVDSRAIAIELATRENEVIVRVIDAGPGPAAAMMAKLFEPFATDKPDGTGLGLAVAQEIAQAHGGEIRCQRADGRTCFEVRLAANSSM